MTGRNDWDAYTTVAALRLKYNPPSGQVLVCIGDSLLLEAFTSLGQLQSDLRTAGLDAQVHLLATDAQTLWESGTICDQLPVGSDTIVLFAISPLQMLHDRSKLEKLLDEPRMALDSNFFYEECRRAGLQPHRTRSFFLNNSHFFASRIIALDRLLIGGVEPSIHYVTSTQPKWDEKTWATKAPAITRRLNKPENLPAMFELLDRIVQRLVKRDGVRVVIMDMPRSPRMRESLAEVESVYRTRLTELAARYEPGRLMVWHSLDEVPFHADDFHDLAHLSTDDSRRRHQGALCDRLAHWTLRNGEVEGDE
jgi:hypothetical protein